MVFQEAMYYSPWHVQVQIKEVCFTSWLQRSGKWRGAVTLLATMVFQEAVFFCSPQHV
jgi:hypothetical protein